MDLLCKKHNIAFFVAHLVCVCRLLFFLDPCGFVIILDLLFLYNFIKAYNVSHVPNQMVARTAQSSAVQTEEPVSVCRIFRCLSLVVGLHISSFGVILGEKLGLILSACFEWTTENELLGTNLHLRDADEFLNLPQFPRVLRFSPNEEHVGHVSD